MQEDEEVRLARRHVTAVLSVQELQLEEVRPLQVQVKHRVLGLDLRHVRLVQVCRGNTERCLAQVCRGITGTNLVQVCMGDMGHQG